MAVKPIVRINVDDTKFREFFENFQKYDAMLNEQVDKWKRINEEMANSSKSLIPNFLSLGGITKTISQNLHSAFVALRNLTGLGAIAGLAGIGGGLFGLDRLANAASSYQRQSSGLGTSTGDMLAFRLNSERYVNSDSLLEKVADMQHTPSNQQLFHMLGIGGIQQKDPAELAYETMIGMRDAFKKYRGNFDVLDALGFGQLFSHDEMRRLGSTEPGELERQRQQEQVDREKLKLSKDEAMQWQNLKTRLGVAGEAIELTLIHGLVPLTGPLAELSTSFNDVVRAFLQSSTVRDGITMVGHWLHEFATYLQTPQFKEDVEKTLIALKKFETGLESAYDWIASFFKTSEVAPPGPAVPTFPDATGGTSDPSWGAHPEGVPHEIWDPIKRAWEYVTSPAFRTTPPPAGGIPGGAEKFENYESRYDLPHGLLWEIEGLESSHNTDPSTRVENAAHALGPFQITPDTAKDLGLEPIDRLDEGKSADAAARYLRQLMDQFGGRTEEALEKAIVAYRVGPSALRAEIARTTGEGRDWHAGLADDPAWRDVPHYLATALAGLHATPPPTRAAPAAPAVPAVPTTVRSRVDVRVATPPGYSVSTSVRSLAAVPVGGGAAP